MVLPVAIPSIDLKVARLEAASYALRFTPVPSSKLELKIATGSMQAVRLLVRPGRHLAWWTCHQIGLETVPSECAASMTYAPQMFEGEALDEKLAV
jgi:hypothetical protein